jgi:two-component system sensor histidine kinase KdpD
MSVDEPAAERGRLRVYLGAAPGVGKTYAALEEAHVLRQRGHDVVVGFVETHGRSETAAKVGDLEVFPRQTISYRGSPIEEMDLPALLARAPETA